MGRAADLVAQGYTGYQGWGDAEANADFNATGGSGKRPAAPSISSPSVPDPVETARRLAQFTAEQNAPAIASLQASQDPLKQRYQDLIANLKGNQQVAENRQTVSTKNELARRGIVGGGLYDQQLTDAVQPIGLQYSNLMSQANTGQSADLAAIQNQIAQLQTGNPAGAIQGALQYGGLQQQAQTLAAQIAQQQREYQLQQQAQQQNYSLAQQQQQLAQQQFNQISLPQALAQIANLKSLTNNRGASSSATSLPSLDSIFG